MANPFDKLKQARKSRGWSLRELASKVGVHFTTLADYEKGKIDPPLSQVIAVAAALDATVDVLMTSRGPLTVPQEAMIDAAIQAAPFMSDDQLKVLEALFDQTFRAVRPLDKTKS